MTRGVGVVLALLASLLVAAAPADADTGSVTDPAQDSAVGPDGPGLDITGADLDNGAHRLVVTVAFDSLRRGDLVVSVAPRGGAGLRLVSYYRPDRPARSFILTGSFDDRGSGRVPCAGFRARWNRTTATARLSMPARCLAHAEYGDLRFAVLTETDGGDTDHAPGTHTRWIARG